MAFPAAMNAGISAAKGRRPPFCLVRLLLLLLLVPLHLFFLLRTMMSLIFMRVYSEWVIMTKVDARCFYN